MNITSLQNPIIKNVFKLQQKASLRKSTGLFVAEGRREASLAINNGIHIEHLLICPEIYKPDPQYRVDLKAKHVPTPINIPLQVYNKLAYRKDVEGLILVGKAPEQKLEDMALKDHPLILVLEKVEKPGNLGAILRTADAAGVDAVIITNPATDMYNPNVIRASLGCVFTLAIVTATTSHAISWLKDQEVSIYATALQTDICYYGANMRNATALVFGAEDKGLSIEWRQAAKQIIKIPMSGRIDSLNISASVAVLTFEAIRQRAGFRVTS